MPTHTPYRDIAALVVDDMAAQLTTLRGQLQMLGLARVDAASNAEDAVRQVRSKPYGLILCDYNLNQKTDGQQLFEHLRDTRAISEDCLFFMVTAENAYKQVASASEMKPDAYLLKPITASEIEERLKFCMERRQALLPVLQRMAKEDHAGAAAEADRLIARKDRWLMQAYQLKGDALLHLGRHQDARQTFHDVLDLKPQLVWAQLGLARALKAANLFEEAKQAAYDIINSKDGERNVGAYDVIAQVLEAQGESQAAMWVLRDAATAVPSAKRERLVAESAYRNGDLETARASYAKVLKSTQGAITAQSQDCLGLAQTLADAGEVQACMALLEEGGATHRNAPSFDGVAQAIRTQALVKLGDTAGAMQALARARSTMRKAKADFATVALAKAEIASGALDAGLKLLSTAVSADHESPWIKQMVGRALEQAGHADKTQAIVAAASAALTSRVDEAKALFRNSRMDDALAAIEEALKEHPENTGVLLQAAQMNCLALRLNKQLNTTISERVRLYLSRLEKLMPANDRVMQMQRYYRETLEGLKKMQSRPAPAATA